jgi:hypothetical protein
MFASWFASTSVVIVSALIFFIVVGMFVGPFWNKISGSDKIWKYLAVIGIVVAFLIVTGNIFGSNIPSVEAIELPGLSNQDVTFLTLVGITILIILFLVGSQKLMQNAEWTLMPR